MRPCLALLLLTACPHRLPNAPPQEGETGETGATGPEAPLAVPFGLQARPANPTCVAMARPHPPAAGNMALVKAFPNLTFDKTAPIALAHVKIGPNGARRWFSA